MKTMVVLWILALVLSGSALSRSASAQESEAAAETGSDTPKLEFPPEIERLLTETSDPEEYSDTVRCVRSRSIRQTRILDDRHIVFEMPSKKYYLVQFKRRCQRLQPDSTLVYETRADQLCRLDQIRASNNFGMRDVGPPCSIPGFVSVTPEQVAQLREYVKARRRQEIEALKKDRSKEAEEPAPQDA